MKTWFVLKDKLKPIPIAGSQVRYSEELVKKFILQFTRKGDKILDPFAGFGTTLIVAEKLGRIGYGIEYEQERVDYIKKNIKLPTRIIHGNALKIGEYKLPKFDFSMASPPYMRSSDKENPFSNYSKKGNYKQYLRDISTIYKQIKKLMKPNAVIIVEVSNTYGNEHQMTPLAWDVGYELAKIFFLERELIHCSNNEPAEGSNHSYILVFRNK